MPEMPQEMATQRRRNSCVSAPGVNLWASNIAYLPDYRVDVENTDTVSAGEVDIAQAPPPYFEYDVDPEYYYPEASEYGEGYYGDGPYSDPSYPFPQSEDFGIFQAVDFGEGAFGEGVFGGVDLEYNYEVIQYGYPFEGNQ